MNEKPISELIDDYVSGQVSPDEKAYLEELSAIDPDVRSQLRTAREAYDFLERSYYRNVKKKLQEYDRSVEIIDIFSSEKMLRLVVISVLMIAFFWMISYGYYQPANVAKRLYQPFIEQIKEASTMDTIAHLKSTADKAFEKRDYADAATTMQLIISHSGHDDRYTAEWNFLMCQIAIHGFTPEWIYRLDEMIVRSDEPIRGKAIELKKQLNSWIYRFTFLKFSPELSALKPRLI